jgi:peptidyl-prolyl cis-trans isomerase A (cyclophilin A)
LLVAFLALICSAGTAAAGTLIRFDFEGFGTVDVDLFDDLAPLTVANIKQHINAGTYTDSMIHRVDVGLGVIQGGGFGLDALEVSPIFGPVVNESSAQNRRGTLAMARSTHPDSARSQWFFNTEDNQSELDNSTTSGYAVFGWVVGGGMQVVDDIADVPTFVFATPFGQIPLQDFSLEDYENGTANPLDHLVVLNGVSIVKTHATFQNPVLAPDVDNSNLVDPLDALLILNDIIIHDRQPHPVEGIFSNDSLYRDVSGDGSIDQLDLLQVINALILQDQQGLLSSASPLVADSAYAASAAPQSFLMVVPEPASLALLTTGSVALAAGAHFMRRRRRGAPR